jgi:Glycosyl hydrolase family 71
MRIAVLLVALVVGVTCAATTARAATPENPIPVFAYHYIWFNATSWERAKIDYPLLGRYSSDETSVMRQQIRWAKQAGIDAFIVSWKSTTTLNRRLEALMRVARRSNFKLAVIYQGLDFEREPLPISQVREDMQLFARKYASDPVFAAMSKPVLIWSGTWRFTRKQIESVAQPLRRRAFVLATEKSKSGYERVADLVDGNAYYWSSGDPLRTPGYTKRLADMGAAVHENGGLWIAPVAPGFDARLVGGTSVIPRRDGQTLRHSLNAAVASSPDAIGVISWNEFSENTHIEPSELYGTASLRELADALGAKFVMAAEFDSSEPAATDISHGRPLFFGLVVFMFIGVVTFIWRVRGKDTRPPGSAIEGDVLRAKPESGGG